MQMTKYYSDHIPFQSSISLSPVRAKIRNFVAIMALWCAHQRERRVLKNLDEQLLQDIGLTRGQALEEAGKPFWDVETREGM